MPERPFEEAEYLDQVGRIHPYPNGYVSSADRHPMDFLIDFPRKLFHLG